MIDELITNVSYVDKVGQRHRLPKYALARSRYETRDYERSEWEKNENPYDCRGPIGENLSSSIHRR
jgi:hypothetical protein